jgi:hypothetical protein
MQTLETIEAEIAQLPLAEQLRLIERLASRLRAHALGTSTVQDSELAAMANDPAIQRELRRIDAEFASTEADGLDRV